MDKKTAPIFRILIPIALGAILFLVVWLLSSKASLGKATTQIPQLPTVTVGHGEETFPEIPRVSLSDARAALGSRTVIFVDVRSAENYSASHIPGALNIPLGEIETRMNELDPDKWIITYCTLPDEDSSARAARILLDNGFKNVTSLRDGFYYWQHVGYPVEP